MNGCAQGILEAARGVGRKVDGDGGSGSYCTCHFNVEHDLSICALRRGGVIGSVIDRHSLHVWHGKAEAGEVVGDVGGPESST